MNIEITSKVDYSLMFGSGLFRPGLNFKNLTKMKKVFNSAYDVIHLFAQRTQDEARCNNVFFEGNRIYSYGRHYLLGEFITNSKGESAIWINNTGYSNTTAKHISILTSATTQYRQFFETDTNARKVFNQLDNFANKLINARKKELYINPALRLFEKFTEFQIWNGSSNDIDSVNAINEIMPVFQGKEILIYLKEHAERIKKEEKEEKEKKKWELKQAKEDLKKFFAYEKNTVYNMPEQYLRISKDGKEIETTLGVHVPVKLAAILYKKIVNGENIKGFQLEHYTVIGINGVLKIGCHNINIKNMHEIGKQII